MKKFLIANNSQTRKIFSLYNGMTVEILPGEHKVIRMFDTKAITRYTDVAKDEFVNGVLISCNPTFIEKFLNGNETIKGEAENATQTATNDNSTTLEDIESTEEDTATSNDETVTEVTTEESEVEDKDNVDENDILAKSAETEDTETTNSEELLRDEKPDYSQLSLEEMRDLLANLGIDAHKWNRNKCLKELNG